MNNNKYDFSSATRLINVLSTSAITLKNKNEDLITLFGKLKTSFNDSGYTELEPEIKKANNSLTEVITQIVQVAKKIDDYRIRIEKAE